MTLFYYLDFSEKNYGHKKMSETSKFNFFKPIHFDHCTKESVLLMKYIEFLKNHKLFVQLFFSIEEK